MKLPAQLNILVAAKLGLGELPATMPVLTMTGTGDGHTTCAACDEPIEAADVQCTCDFRVHPRLRFHVVCFTEWRRQQAVSS